MNIEFATPADYEYLVKNDHHVTPEVIKTKLNQGEIIIIHDTTQPIGWLRYGYFWDEIPFMNMLRLEESYRGQGWGRKLVAFWEAEMRQRGHPTVLTSTLANEQAQHFYRKLGYQDGGALLLPNEALEIIFIKKLTPLQKGQI
jgi:ribosomal protein S18 acetylase RimI-like enzyme